MLCKLAETLDLKEGRIITQSKSMASLLPPRIVIGADNTLSQYQEYNLTQSTTWTKHRLTWWNSFDLHNDPKIAVRLDYWDGANWVQISFGYYPRLTGGVNRVGVGTWTSTYWPNEGVNFDDTEIYTPET